MTDNVKNEPMKWPSGFDPEVRAKLVAAIQNAVDEHTLPAPDYSQIYRSHPLPTEEEVRLRLTAQQITSKKFASSSI